MKTKSKSFTLIELLVVVFIIGLLALLVTVSFHGERAKARDAKRRSDIATIKSALEMYYDDHGYYPVCSNPGSNSSCLKVDETNTTYAKIDTLTESLTPKYLLTMPKDPLSPKKRPVPGDSVDKNSSKRYPTFDYYYVLVSSNPDGRTPEEKEISGYTLIVNLETTHNNKITACKTGVNIPTDKWWLNDVPWCDF